MSSQPLLLSQPLSQHLWSRLGRAQVVDLHIGSTTSSQRPNLLTLRDSREITMDLREMFSE